MGGVHGVAVRRRKGGPCTGSACGSAVDSDDVSRQRAGSTVCMCVYFSLQNIQHLSKDTTHVHTTQAHREALFSLLTARSHGRHGDEFIIITSDGAVAAHELDAVAAREIGDRAPARIECKHRTWR